MVRPEAGSRDKFHKYPTSPRDWKEAGLLVARMTHTEPGRKSKIQELLNDILLALCARRIGADLSTYHRADFELLRRHEAFSLHLLG